MDFFGNITSFFREVAGMTIIETNFILFHFLQKDTMRVKKEFHKFLERTCQSANFLREIIKNSWLGVCLSQLQTELLGSYQTDMISFILQYFHLQRTEKHWIPFQTLFGPSFLIFTCTLFFLFRTITKMRSMLKSWIFGSPITCTNLPVLHCGVNQD